MQGNIGPPGQRTSDDAVVHSENCPRENGLGHPRKVMSHTNLQCVAICTVGELFGGVERHVLGIISGLKEQGVSALLILFHDGELALQAREQGIETLILPNKNRLLLTTTRLLARILNQRKVHIVHVHGYKAMAFCFVARQWHHFEIVKTEHGLPEPMAGGPIRTLRNRLYYFSDSAATRIARTTICYVTEDLRTYYRLAHSGLRAMVIPNGVANMNRDQFPRPPEMREDWFSLLVVGRLDIVKGHHVAIEAMATQGLPANVHLYLIGVGPREQELRTLAESLGVTRQVHVLGFRRNVYDYIAHCDALLMPSLHEGLPYTLLEAMALGIPIIASRIGGLAEVLRDGTTALLVPPLNAADLARAIVRLHSDAGLRVRLAEKAQHLQQSKYSLGVMTESYLAVYRQLNIFQ